MKPQTFGRNYDIGRMVPIQCVKDDTLRDLNIEDACFCLLIIYEGTVNFQIGDLSFAATAPCFVCFDESNSPKILRKRGVKCDSVYFEPTFLNVNMTFSRVHSGGYEQIALAHDLFLLKPFTDTIRYVFPVFDELLYNLKQLFSMLENELKEQSDWYWSCRGRSYFMEIIIALERMYGLIGYGPNHRNPDNTPALDDPKLRDAVLYIDPANPESIAQAITKLDDDTLRNKLIEKGRQQRTLFSWDRTAELLWNSLMRTIEDTTKILVNEAMENITFNFSKINEEELAQSRMLHCTNPVPACAAGWQFGIQSIV